jgi:hypothetical protein
VHSEVGELGPRDDTVLALGEGRDRCIDPT